MSGWMCYVLKEKLKALKGKIKVWNRGEYEGMEERVEKLAEEIRVLDEKGEEGSLVEEEVSARKDRFEELWRLLKAKDAPKVSSPMELKDFRSISLLGSLYKLLSKVLARRLAGVMNSIISPSQLTFIKGRNLVDGVLVVNELVDYARRAKECLIFKVDFEKAYDSVDWGFLEYMLYRVGMCEKWVAWVKACVCGGSMSILVNGSPTEEICIRRGLKQGDRPPCTFLVSFGGGGI